MSRVYPQDIGGRTARRAQTWKQGAGRARGKPAAAPPDLDARIDLVVNRAIQGDVSDVFITLYRISLNIENMVFHDALEALILLGLEGPDWSKKLDLIIGEKEAQRQAFKVELTTETILLAQGCSDRDIAEQLVVIYACSGNTFDGAQQTMRKRLRTKFNAPMVALHAIILGERRPLLSRWRDELGIGASQMNQSEALAVIVCCAMEYHGVSRQGLGRLCDKLILNLK